MTTGFLNSISIFRISSEMGAIITLLANFANLFRVPSISHGERKRASLQRNNVIEELKLMERCTPCYLDKRAHELVSPWLECQHPWKDTSLVDLVRSKDGDSGKSASFGCCHSEEEKYLNPPPDLVNSIFGKETIPNYLRATTCLVCDDNWEDCKCICTVCGGDSCLNTLMEGYHDRITEDSSSRESDQGVDCAPVITDSEPESENLPMDKNNNYSSP